MVEQTYYFKKVTARKNCYCSQCELDIEKKTIKCLVYVNNPYQTEYHQHENGEVEKIEHIHLIGITHEDCLKDFVEKNKKEHSELIKIN